MQITFLLLALGLSAMALGFLLYPFLRDPARVRLRARREINAEIHRDRLAELDHDLAQGTLTREQYDEAVADLDRELVESGAVDPDEPARVAGPMQRRITLTATVATAVAVPLLAMGLYNSIGFGEQALADNQTAEPERPGAARGSSEHDAADTAEVRRLAERLRERLQEEPNEVRGWILLARTLMALEDHEQSVEAFEEAYSRGADSEPQFLLLYAEALGEAGGTLRGRPQQLIDRALELEPENPRGLWLAGNAAYYRGDYDAAREHWQHLLGVLPEDSDAAEVVRSNLESVAEISGMN